MTDRGYGRISLDTERSGSKVKQRSRIAEEAKGDWEWYFDESVSGSKIPFPDRPNGARLLADLQKGDRVLITKIDRAARSVTDLLSLVKLIDEKGATVKFVDQPFLDTDPSNPFGRFILTLLAAIAELEAGIIGERRRESLKSFAEEGRHAVGAAPFGFHSVPNPNGRGLVIRPHPENGPVLKDAIERLLKGGETQEAIAESIGLKKVTFNRLLRNPRLAGMTPDKEGVVTINGTPRIDPEAALLTMTEWSRLQASFKQGHSWSRHEGIGAALICCNCGGRLYYASPGKRKQDKPGYKCARTAPEHKVEGLPSASVGMDKAEEYVIATFLDRFGDTKGVVTYWEDSDHTRTEAISLAEVALAEVRRRQDAAETDEEEEALDEEARKARKALRAAKALPSNRRLVTVPSGMTIREEWEAAGPATRVTMLKVAGEWIVQPGRLPIEDKIILKPRAHDHEELVKGLTPLS